MNIEQHQKGLEDLAILQPHVKQDLKEAHFPKAPRYMLHPGESEPPLSGDSDKLVTVSVRRF